ncbi:MAG: leucine-rich repeat protein, partial [Treponema sp.]|nr:leucine-rich repeat protein [Treponema sp.]
MKTKKEFLMRNKSWTITFLAVISFVMTILSLMGCPPQPDGEDSKTIVSIAVIIPPNKIQYNLNDELTLAGMVVTATYSDGSTMLVTGYTTTGFDSSTIGNKTVTVSYGGKTTIFTVMVRESISEDPVFDFTDIATFRTWLSKQSPNNASNPYEVKLNVIDFNSLLYALNANSTKYVSLDLSDSTVTSIGSLAFYNCTNLISITIGDNVTSIEEYAFQNSSSLASVTIGNNVTSIGGFAFEECTGLTSITIPNSVTSIGDGAFYNCTSLTNVMIPNSVTTIEQEAFWSCTSLTSITIPDSVTDIGGRAFQYCTSLASVTIGNNVTSIESGVFSGCTSLTNVMIPNSVTSRSEERR